MTHVVRDPVMVFRFAIREGDVALATGLLRLLRGERLPSQAALRAFAQLVRALGLNGARDYDR